MEQTYSQSHKKSVIKSQKQKKAYKSNMKVSHHKNCNQLWHFYNQKSLIIILKPLELPILVQYLMRN